MNDLSELHSQNHSITEVSNVYRYLVRNRSLCDTEIAGRLLFDYVQKVGDHLELVDRSIAKRLLADQDPRTQNLARKFIAESAFLKKLTTEYLGQWSRKKSRQLLIKDHETFVRETDEMFDLVLDRLQRETEHIYPLWQKLHVSKTKTA
jgi:hypothetical protein